MKIQIVHIKDEQGKLLHRISLKAKEKFTSIDFGRLSTNEQDILSTLFTWALKRHDLINIYIEQSIVKTKPQKTAHLRNATRAINSLIEKGLIHHTPSNELFCIPAVDVYLEAEQAAHEAWLKG